MRRTWSSIVAVIALAAILIGINMLAETRLANVQADLTSHHLYTLSSGTRSVLGGLKAVIRVPVTPADEKPGPLAGAEQGEPQDDI